MNHTNKKDDKVFDTWDSVKECTDCEHWWNNTCDSSTTTTERPCRAYLPTRKVTIPNDIKQLKAQMIFVHIVLIVLSLLHVLEVIL